MSYRRLGEGCRNLIIDYLKAGLPDALNEVGAAAKDPQMTLEDPRQYFVYEKPQGLALPAVFVIVDSINFRIAEKQANHVNAKARVNVSILVEDQDEETLTYKADRYLSALHGVLDQANIVAEDGAQALTVVVYNATFSPRYMAQEAQGDGGKFRKEVLLECQVELMETT